MSQKRIESVQVEGGSFDLHLWTPPAGHGPGLLLIQEIFGVGPYIEAVAERLAAAGYVVAAPDVFWRFHPRWVAAHDEAGVAASMALAQNLRPELAVADCVAALGHLAGLAEVDGAPGVIGFCLGGSLAWGVAAASQPACCVSYYGSFVPQMLGLRAQISCPVLLHFGGQDPFIPREQVSAVEEALAGAAGFTVNVEAAGHAFDNHLAPIFHNPAAAERAWAKTMAFLGEHLPVGGGAAS
ncbi:MAG: dienelactone hydrolase family protein [Myxococcales bacterium]|nr:dienelactone hydrolase family protein [Myxococcales bacterium]